MEKENMQLELLENKENEIDKLSNSYKEELNKLNNLNQTLEQLYSIYPSYSPMKCKTPIEVSCLNRKEVDCRINNFILFKLTSAKVDTSYSNTQQSLESNLNSLIKEITNSESPEKERPILCYGIHSKDSKRTVFLGIQNSLNPNKEERDFENENRKKHLINSCESKKFGIEELPTNFLTADKESQFFPGYSVGFPHADQNNTNIYNELLQLPKEKDYTLLILAKPVTKVQKKEFKNLAATITSELEEKVKIKFSESITKQIEKSQSYSKSVTKTQETTKVKNKVMTLTPAFASMVVGSIGGAMIAGSIGSIPLPGMKKCAASMAPILMVTGAVVGTKYLTTLTSSIQTAFTKTSKKSVSTSETFSTSISEIIGRTQSFTKEHVNYIAKENFEFAKKAYDRFSNVEDVLYQTVVTFTSNLCDVPGSIQGKLTNVMEDNIFYFEKSNENVPRFLIPDNFFRNKESVVLNPLSNLITSTELSHIIQCPTAEDNSYFKIETN